MKACLIAINYQNGPEYCKDGLDLLSQFLESLECVDLKRHSIWLLDDGSPGNDKAIIDKWFCSVARMGWAGGIKDNRGLNWWRTKLLGTAFSGRDPFDVAIFLDCDITLRECFPFGGGCPITAICDYFEKCDPSVGIVAPMQLHPDGWVWAFGDRTIHPVGYHHVGMGCFPHNPDFQEPIEVESVMGAFLAVRWDVYQDSPYSFSYGPQRLDPEFPAHGRGLEEEWQFRCRLAGWKIHAIPHVSFTHWHQMRRPRTGNPWDSPEKIQEALDYFRGKLGFDRLKPNLGEFQKRYDGTPVSRPLCELIDESKLEWTAPDGVVHKVDWIPYAGY